MLTIFLSGDVMTGRGIDQILAHPVDPRLHEPYVKDANQYVELAEEAHGEIPEPVGDRYIWGSALESLEQVAPDARVINLETAVTNSEAFWKGKAIHYRMSPANLGCLNAARIDCCNLANNHVLDWGEAGLTETLTSLEQSGLKTAGAGRSPTMARRPAIVPTGEGGRVLVFGLAMPSSGTPPAWDAGEDHPAVAFLPDLSDGSFAQIRKAIESYRRPADTVIVSVHWGGNWDFQIPPDQQRFAYRLIEDAGVDIVHGHSSHHVKGIEVYRDRLILYGCGDLITDYEGISGHESFRGDLGLMYFPELEPGSGALKRLRMRPTVMKRFQLQQPESDEIRWLESTLNREGGDLGTSVKRDSGGWLTLEW